MEEGGGEAAEAASQDSGRVAMASPDWSQNESEVTVKIDLTSSVSKDQLKVKIQTSSLTVLCGASPIFDEELSGKVNVDESYWQLEGPEDAKKLVAILCKKKALEWRTLTKAEAEQLPEEDVMAENFNVDKLEHDDDDPELVEEQEENERKLEARYKKLVAEKGIDNEDTLNTFFALFDNCIQLYRLNKLSDYLEDVVPVCRKRGDKFKMKGIQALSFVRWKQSRFREALPLFHEMEEHLGKSAALCENIAHTYNSLGDFEKAEDYFRQALRFIEQEHGQNKGNRGGVLLGLGIVRDRLGKHKEALPVCLKAYEFYKERANGAPASLQAKAAISCAKLHAKLGDLPKAESFIREAVQMYEITCGETSPLTASAYHELGKCLWSQRKRADAQKALLRAYELEGMKDAWDLVTILEVHNLLMDTHLKETTAIQREKFADYFDVVNKVTDRVKKELTQDGNAAVYYKAAAELKAWGGEYGEAKALFNVAIPLLKTETSTDTSGLVRSCEEMVSFCDRNLAGTQASPMNFSISEADKKSGGGYREEGDGADAGDGGYEGPIIEEVDEKEEAAVSSSRPAAPASSSPSTGRAVAGADAEPEEAASPVEMRPLEAGRAAEELRGASELCASTGVELLLSSAEELKAHLEGPGKDLCWAESAGRGGPLSGLALCGSDGVFGQLLQLAVRPEEPKADMELKSKLIRRCSEACYDRGLRGLRAAVPMSSDEHAVFATLGWRASHQVWASPENDRPSKKGRTEATGSSAASSSAAPAPKSDPKLKRDDKDVNTYYQAWDKVNVEKTLVEEDGRDPSIVPDRFERAAVDFGELDSGLDVTTRISRFAWDQSEKTVSVYVPFEGVSEENVQAVFRPLGVLIVINHGGKKHWYKVPNLCHEIDTAASLRKIKKDEVVLKLRKAAVGTSWSDLNDEKDKYQKMREYRIQHGDLKGATTEELLADMYQNANDDDRAGLRDAMRVNREKKEEDAKKAKGN